MLKEIFSLSFAERNTTEWLVRALFNCIVPVSSRSRSYGLHVEHATAVAECTCRTHETTESLLLKSLPAICTTAILCSDLPGTHRSYLQCCGHARRSRSTPAMCCRLLGNSWCRHSAPNRRCARTVAAGNPTQVQRHHDQWPDRNAAWTQ